MLLRSFEFLFSFFSEIFMIYLVAAESYLRYLIGASTNTSDSALRSASFEVTIFVIFQNNFFFNFVFNILVFVTRNFAQR